MKIEKRNIKKIIFKLYLLSALFIGLFSSYFTFNTGLGSWNINNHIVWGLDITTFIFWIGVGHSGTFVSAILLLFRQEWREEIARLSEIITIVSIFTASLIPVFHIGRFWLAYWIFPYKNQMALWVNFKSALEWDFFAISIYLISSILYLYFSLLPEFNKIYKIQKKKIWFILSLGWQGTNIQWMNYHKLMILLSGIISAMVIAVHSIVSFDFSVTIMPQWHSTFNPIFFVSGAIFSGIAMIFFVSILFEKLDFGFKLSDLVIDKLSKLLIFFCFLLLYQYLIELFSVQFSSNLFEQKILFIKYTGNYTILNFIYLLGVFLVPNLLFFKRIREKRNILLFISILILISMWIERFLFVVLPLQYDFISNTVFDYKPSLIEFGLLYSSFGLFCFGIYFLFKKIQINLINE